MKRKVVVCGGSRGIGAACIKDLSENNFLPICISRSPGEIKSFIDNGMAIFEPCDLTNAADRRSVISKVIENHNIWGLVNNASGPSTGSVIDTNSEKYLAAFETHLFASNDWARALYPNFLKQGEGRIVNIISVTAKVPLENMCVSNTLRGAMLNWSKTLSKEFGRHNINVNNVLPGYTETDRLLEVIKNASAKESILESEYREKLVSQIPLRRFGRPEELASVVRFLLSQDSSYVNGVSIPVDGGWTTSI